MKKAKQILNLLTTAIIAITLTTSCGKGSGSNSTESKKNDVQRPTESDSEAKKLLGKYDSKVASIMQSLREYKKAVKEADAKMTVDIENNYNQMFNEAKQLKKQVEELSDKLSVTDFDLFERDSERLQEKEMDFDTYKQKK